MTSKRLILSWVAVAALLLTGCNPIPAEPPAPAGVSTPGPACAALNEMAREALATAPPPPARARFGAADRKAFAGSAFGYLCELSEEVGSRESATKAELEAAEFLIDRFTEFGYSPEVQDFGESITGTEFMGPPPGPSRNILLELPGRGEGVVILGAHYDTVPDSAGANDNASGMGVLLALAEMLARPPWSNQEVSVFPFNTTVYRLWFGGDRTARQLALRGAVDRRRNSRHQGHDQPGLGGFRHNSLGYRQPLVDQACIRGRREGGRAPHDQQAMGFRGFQR